MSNQHICHEVQNMLKSIYKDESVLQYEETPEHQIILNELLKSVMDSEKISNMYLQDLKSKNEELTIRAEKMRLCFESAFLSPSSLENVSQSTLRNLAACACILNLKDLDETSYLQAITRLIKDQLTIAKDRKKEQLLHRKYSDSMESLILRTDCLQNKLYLIGDQSKKITMDMENMKHSSQVSDKKSSVVVTNIALNGDHLKSAGLESTLLHGTLVKQSQKLREMERKCDILSIKLGRFQGLPANKDLAIAEVEKLKEEIKGLDMTIYTAASKNSSQNAS